MEEDIQKHLASPIAASKAMVKIEDKLKEAVEVAQERLDYEAAHNEELLRALALVADFIKRKKRVCYGGTAMNAILPDKLKFYSAETDLPDYDFYTPSLTEDVDELVADLKKEGFKEVYHKVGMHEGTKKILVNFMPIADMSAIEPELFHILFRRSILREGIHYTDPDVLRMMMYLELSRPKGEVSRWEKVFERLQLINHAFPIRACGRGSAAKRQIPTVPASIRRLIIDYIIEQQRILCNGPIRTLYEQGIRHGRVRFDPARPGPAVLFTSPDPRADAVAIKGLLKGEEDVRLFLHKTRGEIVPERIELRAGNKTVALIVKEVACHSHNTVQLDDGRFISIGSLEFLVTLYLALDIFTAHSKDILGERALCEVAAFIALAGEGYRAKRSVFPAFALSCRGHQTGFASLLRAKVLRIKREREGGKSALRSRSATKKARRGRRRATSKAKK